jgi:hypothetical protein
MLSMDARFRYIDAPQVDTPAGRLKGTTLVSPTNATLGTLDGIVIDPIDRRVLFYVFKSPGWFSSHHYLLPQMPARLNSERHTLEVEVEAADIEQLDEVEPASFPRFSDEDLIRAMFHSRPA